MNQLSDKKILSGLRSKDEREKDISLNQLYAHEYPLILAFVTKNNGSEEEAADIFQDAIIVFYEKIRMGELELRSSIRTYIYSVCKNLWMNRLRAQKKIQRIDDDMDDIPIAPESLNIIKTSERQEIIMQLIERVGEDCKKVLTLYYFDRLRMKEVAGHMAFANEQVAKNKKAKCIKKLKALILDSPVLRNILK